MNVEHQDQELIKNKLGLNSTNGFKPEKQLDVTENSNEIANAIKSYSNFKFKPINFERMRSKFKNLNSKRLIVKTNTVESKNEKSEVQIECFKPMLKMRFTEDVNLDDTKKAILFNTSFETAVFDIYNPDYSTSSWKSFVQDSE